MKYDKAQITSVSEAVVAIEGLNRKLLAFLIDSRNMLYLVTLAAYESDE